MKINKLLFLFIFAAFAFVSMGQSVKITSSKITYTRPKPISVDKKNFTVNYPKVKAATPALSRKIESEISYAKVFSLNIQEEKTSSQWLEEADFEVGYNKNWILSVTLSQSGNGAYPSTVFRNVVVNLKTGKLVKPADFFIDLAGLAAEVKKRQQAEIKQAREDYKKDRDTADFDASEYFDNADFKIINLNEFYVSDDGITFTYDYGFPHVILALQPNGNYLLTWAELKPFIRRGGLLEKFVR